MRPTTTLLLFLKCTAILASESGLEAEIKLLKEAIAGQASEIAELQNKMDGKKDATTATEPVWDCYKTQDWTADDIIEFDYCDLNTMTGNPALGLVAIDVPGTYRLTFSGRIKNNVNGGEGGYGWVRLKVNNDVIATSGVGDAFYYGQLSINTLQELLAGDVVAVEFEHSNALTAQRGYLDSTSEHGERFVRWTGQKLL